MTTYVLVHGGCTGGFLWRPIVERLRAAGHEVYAPTLTGLGERVHLAHPDVDLETHIRDVLGVLVYEDLTEVVLAGWSYGGMVITGVADRAPERLAHLVYLDAPVPVDGESQLDHLPPEIRASYEAMVERDGDGWRLPPPVPAAMAERWPYRLFRPQPFKTLAQPLRLTQPPPTLPRTYILCTEKPPAQVAQTRARLAPRTEGWRFHELPTVHMAMLTMPDEVTSLLLDAVARR